MLKNSLLLCCCFFFLSCGKAVHEVFVSDGHEPWQVVKHGIVQANPPLYYEINGDGTFKELLHQNGKFAEFTGNSDFQGYRKWNFINDTTIFFAFLEYRVKQFDEQTFVAVNPRNPGDTLKLVRKKAD